MAQQPTWQDAVGRTWARLQTATDRQLAPVGEALIGLLEPRAGERILDLGCGAGSTCLALARAVGPDGHVTGIDISPDLAALARQRTRTLANVTIIQADAARHRFRGPAHDALFSRHGCMFFTDPAGAFGAIRRGLGRGARVAMSAFTALAENPWTTVPLRAVEEVLGPAPTGHPGPPGPFAWAEPSVFETALATAGFHAIGRQARDVTFTLGAGDDPDPVERACAMVLNIGVVARRVALAGDGAAAAVRPALRRALAAHVRDGWVRLGARIWLISAIA